ARVDGVREIGRDEPWPAAAVAVDALLGTGAAGPARGEVLALAQRLVTYGAPIVAIDGPTGLDLSSGEAHGPVRADVSVTFGGPRRGHLLAREWCGKIAVVDIGFPPPDPAWPVLVTDAWAGARLPKLTPTMHKGDRGRVTVVGGSNGMTGAALHAARAALAAGAGLVKLVAGAETISAPRSSPPRPTPSTGPTPSWWGPGWVANPPAHSSSPPCSPGVRCPPCSTPTPWSCSGGRPSGRWCSRRTWASSAPSSATPSPTRRRTTAGRRRPRRRSAPRPPCS